MRDPNGMRVVDQAMLVAELTYTLTKSFPTDERFGLVSQMRRAAVSIGSNISEGCGRSTESQFLHFLQFAMGSACELEFQVRLAERLGLAREEEIRSVIDSVVSVKKMLSKLGTHVRS